MVITKGASKAGLGAHLLAHFEHVLLHFHLHFLVFSHVDHQCVFKKVVFNLGFLKQFVLHAGLLDHHLLHHNHGVC
jgi:hypothetical protein